jgi:hypothetical protein
VLVALLAARAKALRGRPAGDRLRLVAYSSDQAHSCFKWAPLNRLYFIIHDQTINVKQTGAMGTLFARWMGAALAWYLARLAAYSSDQAHSCFK